jgi:hypothetical protein
MENTMTEQRTREDYRDVLEELAISRGFSGAEELAEEVVKVGPDYTERDILEAGHGGFGIPLDRVLEMTEEEKVRLTHSLAEGMRVAEALGICAMPGCKRPAVNHPFGCREHVRVFDAQAEVEAWELALKILKPWVESARPIGSDELTRVMREAQEKAEWELRGARRELKEAEAAL